MLSKNLPLFSTTLFHLKSFSTAHVSGSGLNWAEFFILRRRLQSLQRISGIPFSMGFLAAEGMVLSLPVFDPTKMIFGIDPLVMVGLTTIAGSIGFYFAGVALSGTIWRQFKPGLASQLNQKQRDFYTRISRYRANVPPNPTQMNFSFDYYGEKIRSISDYRSWLRRQFKMKKERSFSTDI